MDSAPKANVAQRVNTFVVPVFVGKGIVDTPFLVCNSLSIVSDACNACFFDKRRRLF